MRSIISPSPAKRRPKRRSRFGKERSKSKTALTATVTFTSLPTAKPGWDFWRRKKTCFGRCSPEKSGCMETPNGCRRSNAASLREIKKAAQQFHKPGEIRLTKSRNKQPREGDSYDYNQTKR